MQNRPSVHAVRPCRAAQCVPDRDASGLLLAFLFITLLCGCGGPSGTDVKGKVRWKGQPLPRGTITFFGDSDTKAIAIGSDGAFACQLQPGDYRAAVLALPEIPPGAKETDPMPPDDIGLDPKYAMPTTSGITATVDGTTVTFQVNDAWLEIQAE